MLLRWTAMSLQRILHIPKRVGMFIEQKLLYTMKRVNKKDCFRIVWKCCQQFYTSLTFFECFDSVTKTFFNLIIVWFHFWSQNRHIWWRWSKRIYWLNELLRCAVVVKRKQMRSCHRHILFTFRSLFILTL